MLVLLTLLVAGLLRSHAEILRRLHALGAGLDPDGRDRASSSTRVDLRRDAPTSFAAGGDLDGAGLRDDALHVSDRRCAPPHAARVPLEWLPHVPRRSGRRSPTRPASTFPTTFALVVVTKDAQEESISALRKLAPAGVPVVMSSAAWTDYRVPGSPYFVLVDGQAGACAAKAPARTGSR